MNNTTSIEMKIEVQEKENLSYWYSSKPKYPLHVHVSTTSDSGGCITGMEQHFYGNVLTWRYQLTEMTASGPVSSWWAEEDITQVHEDTFDMEEKEGDEVVSGCYLTGLDDVNQFVRDYGKRAIEKYHETGSKREIRICFWDAFMDGSE